MLCRLQFLSRFVAFKFCYAPLLSSLLTILLTLNFLGPLITLSALLLPPDVGIVVGCFSRILRGVRLRFRDDMVDSVKVDG